MIVGSVEATTVWMCDDRRLAIVDVVMVMNSSSLGQRFALGIFRRALCYIQLRVYALRRRVDFAELRAFGCLTNRPA